VSTVGAGTAADIATSEPPTGPPPVAAVIDRGRQQMAGGHEHSLTVAADGSLWAWGANERGQLGDGTTTDRLEPTPVLTGVAVVAASGWHSLALKTDGSLWAWGRNLHRQLGDGTSTGRRSPVRVAWPPPAAAASQSP